MDIKVIYSQEKLKGVYEFLVNVFKEDANDCNETFYDM